MTVRALVMTGVAGVAMVFGVQMATAAGLVETLKNDSRFTIFTKGLEQSEYVQTLEEGSPYTVFAPTDAAFDRLPGTTVDELMTEAYEEEREALVGYHLVEGQLRFEPLIGQRAEVETLIGDDEHLTLDGTHDRQLYVVPITLELIERDGALLAESTRSDQPAIVIRESTTGDRPTDTMSPKQKDRLFIFPARIVEPDIQADNGVIHAVDAVLIPKESRYQIKWERKENQLDDQLGD